MMGWFGNDGVDVLKSTVYRLENKMNDIDWALLDLSNKLSRLKQKVSPVDSLKIKDLYKEIKDMGNDRLGVGNIDLFEVNDGTLKINSIKTKAVVGYPACDKKVTSETAWIFDKDQCIILRDFLNKNFPEEGTK